MRLAGSRGLRGAAAIGALAAALMTSTARADCATPSSWVAGSAELCDGAIVYSDYVDDDYGADTGQIQTTSRTASLAPSAGDQSYPDGKDATADLVRLTLRISGDELQVTGLMNALYEPGATVLAVAIDDDANPATGGGKWGGLDVASRGWERIAFFDHGDPATNTISGTMPLPPGDHWRVQAATAIRSSGQVMNVAFRGVHEHASAQGVAQGSDSGSWFEDEQAAALGRGDVSQFGYDVDVADMRAGATRAQDAGPGLHERVYTSGYTIAPGEGVNVAGVPGRGNGGGSVALGFEQTFQYLGRYQPYGIYIPHRPGPHGMQMLFHGSSSVLSGLVNQPGMQQRFGEELNRVLVVPEARGQNGFGSDISERDLLDVMDDVEASYPIDRDKVFSGGYSQGGYITYRMAELYPDRFAGAVDWVGFTGNDENGTPFEAQGYTAGAVGNVIDLVANLRHVPTVMLYSAADELVHVNTAVAMDQAFQHSDDIFRFYLHPAAEHLTYAFLDDWRKEATYTAGRKLVHDPPRVTYRTAAFLDDPAHGIVHDRAYWVSEIRGRGEGYEDVDLTNRACGGSVPIGRPGTDSGSDPVPWTADFRELAGERPIERRDEIVGTLGNVASLTIDSAATCTAGKELRYSIATDGPATLTFGDGRTLTLDGPGGHSGTLAAPPVAATRRCARHRRARILVRRPHGARLRAVVVRVRGHRQRKIVRHDRKRTVVRVRRLPRRAVRVHVIVHATRHGRALTKRYTRTLAACG